MRTFLCMLLLVFALCASVYGQVSINIVPSATSVKQGDVLGYTITLANTTAPTSISMSALVKYTDISGVKQPDATGAASISVSHPVKITSLSLTIPSVLTYVSNSTKYNGITVTANKSGSTLNISLSKTLQQDDVGTISIQFKVTGVVATSVKIAGVITVPH